MKTLLLFLTFIIKSLQMSNKFCINCKYYKPSPYIYGNKIYATCLFFPIEKTIIVSPITGIKNEYNNGNYRCYDARINETLCGHLGVAYQDNK